MKVCVGGAGSIGATIGAKLAAAGEQVSLVARGEHLRAIRRDGLELIDRVGSRSGNYRLSSSDEPSAFGPQGLVLIAVKAHALRTVLGRLDPLIGPDTAVVPALNGLPWWYFHRVGGPFEATRLRSLDPDGGPDRALDVARVIGCVVSGRIRQDIWSKLIGNLRFNPVAALTGYRMDQICADPYLPETIRQVLSEGIEV